MKIKKTDEETTYSQKSETHTFEINGKKVRVYTHDKQDMLFSDYDSDQQIDPEDAKGLTEVEFEALGEYLIEAVDTKVGEEWETDPCSHNYCDDEARCLNCGEQQ